MDYRFLNRKEYEGISILRMQDNNWTLPYFIIKMGKCCQHIHRHEFVQIEYIWKGRLKHVINDHVFDVYKGDIFLMPPYVPHRFIDAYADSFELVEFEFAPEFINERFSPDAADAPFMDFAYLEPFLVDENRIRPRLNLTGSLQLEVEGILTEILGEDRERRTDFQLVVKALLLRLLVLVKRESAKTVLEDPTGGLFGRHMLALRATVEHLNANYAKDISVADAADMTMVSQTYFRTLFKQMTGKSFTGYLRALRISRAIEMLEKEPRKKVIDVCYDVGYRNVNHFNRIFRQETGLTPMEMRKAAVTDAPPAGRTTKTRPERLPA
jgi:AraC-like DNA-binding protein/mannose-6-phosphate isomerase-like protein (cupin superfamily)